jgi:hypothetical protein
LKEELEKKLSAPAIDVKRAQIQREILETAKRRVKIAKEHAVRVSSLQFTCRLDCILQALVRATIRDQIEATRVGLECLQVSANKIALEELTQQKDAKYAQTMAEWSEGVQCLLLSG